MHTLQKLLIVRLINDNGQNYSTLTKGYDADDNVVFHLKKLQENGYIKKENDKYYITAEGVKLVNSFYRVNLKENAFKMVYVGFVCENNGEFLLKYHDKAKISFYNLPSGAPMFEKPIDTELTRLFLVETGVEINQNRFEFDSFHLKTVKTTKGEVIFDDGFVVYRVVVTNEERQEMQFDKNFMWKSKKEIENIKETQKWPEVDICILRKGWNVYNSYTVISDYHLI